MHHVCSGQELNSLDGGGTTGETFKDTTDPGLSCAAGWAGLGWAGLGWAGLAGPGLGLAWAGAGLGWAGLGLGLGWAGLVRNPETEIGCLHRKNKLPDGPQQQAIYIFFLCWGLGFRV